MDSKNSDKALKARGSDRRTKKDPNYKGPERRNGERRAKAAAAAKS